MCAHRCAHTCICTHRYICLWRDAFRNANRCKFMQIYLQTHAIFRHMCGQYILYIYICHVEHNICIYIYVCVCDIYIYTCQRCQLFNILAPQAACNLGTSAPGRTAALRGPSTVPPHERLARLLFSAPVTLAPLSENFPRAKETVECVVCPQKQTPGRHMNK